MLYYRGDNGPQKKGAPRALMEKVLQLETREKEKTFREKNEKKIRAPTYSTKIPEGGK